MTLNASIRSTAANALDEDDGAVWGCCLSADWPRRVEEAAAATVEADARPDLEAAQDVSEAEAFDTSAVMLSRKARMEMWTIASLTKSTGARLWRFDGGKVGARPSCTMPLRAKTWDDAHTR